MPCPCLSIVQKFLDASARERERTEYMTPEEFAEKINQWSRGTMIENHGTRFLSAGEGRARTQLAFKPSLTQLTGLFHAGAIIALADETATAAAMWETNPTGELRPELFP